MPAQEEEIRVLVTVSKSLHGKVIGRRGATIADIESDYPGVQVKVPRRDDPSSDIVISGPASAVRFAEARVLDICGLGPGNGHDERKQAQALYDTASELFEEAKKHKGKERDDLWAKAIAKKEEAAAAQHEAAIRIFERKNQGYADDQMDLHGLYVQEAVQFVDTRLEKVGADLRNGKLLELSIITGFGHHSKNNESKIKPAVAQLLNDRGFPFTEDPAGGIFLVSCPRGETLTQPAEVPQKQQEQKQEAPQKAQDKAGILEVVIALGKCIFSLFTRYKPSKRQSRNAPPVEIEHNESQQGQHPSATNTNQQQAKSMTQG